MLDKNKKKIMIRIKDFDQNFKTRLYEGVKKIEDNSQAEAVVMIKHSSGKYLSYSLAVAGGVFIVMMVYFMVSPIEYNPYSMLVYAALLSVLTVLAFSFFPELYRLVVPKKIRYKNVEIHARAIFQKAQMYKTIENTAFLVYYSLLEKRAVFLADFGITLLMKEQEEQEINKMFNDALDSDNPKEAILTCLDKLIPIMKKYLPHRDDDINELPDDLDIDL